MVSIHAPTQGATSRASSLRSEITFQSTHPHRVRLTKSVHSSKRGSFNPRTHTGCDLKLHCLITRTIKGFNPRTHTGCDGYYKTTRSVLSDVSIHAPTQGATTAKKNLLPLLSFQSTHPHRVRRCGVGKGQRRFLFQSTHPHRVRLSQSENLRAYLHVSIHAPTQGATKLVNFMAV